MSPDEGKPRDRALPIITIDPSTGQAYPGVAIVPDYCGEDDDR